jgi:hypothetical protein
MPQTSETLCFSQSAAFLFLSEWSLSERLSVG